MLRYTRAAGIAVAFISGALPLSAAEKNVQYSCALLAKAIKLSRADVHACYFDDIPGVLTDRSNVGPSEGQEYKEPPESELTRILKKITGNAKSIQAKRRAIEASQWKCKTPPTALKIELSAWIAHDDVCSLATPCIGWYSPDSEEYAKLKCDQLIETESTTRKEYNRVRALNESAEKAGGNRVHE